MSQFTRFLQERDEALKTLNIEWGRRNIVGRSGVDDEMVLAALHKARYQITYFDKSLRIESRRWLEARGMSWRQGMPWPTNDEF